MEIVKYILTNYAAFIAVGILFLSFGVIIPKYKLYWLIAGLNGRSKKDLEKYNLRYIERYFGIFMIVLGLLVIVAPIVLTFLHKEENIGKTFLIITLSIMGAMVLFGIIKRANYTVIILNTQLTTRN